MSHEAMYLKITSKKQAFDIWEALNEFNCNGRIMSDLFKMFGGTKSSYYRDFCDRQRTKQ